MLAVERGDRPPERRVERLAVALLEVAGLGVGRRRLLLARRAVGCVAAAAAQIDRRPERDHPHPARERAVAVVLGDLRRGARLAHEELLPEPLLDLVDEGRRGSHPRDVGAHEAEVRAVEGLQGAAGLRRAGAGEVQVGGAGGGRRPLGDRGAGAPPDSGRTPPARARGPATRAPPPRRAGGARRPARRRPATPRRLAPAEDARRAGGPGRRRGFVLPTVRGGYPAPGRAEERSARASPGSNATRAPSPGGTQVKVSACPPEVPMASTQPWSTVGAPW